MDQPAQIINEPIPQPVAANPQSPVPSPKTSKIPLILGLILIILVIGISALWLGKSSGGQNLAQPTPTLVPAILEPTPTEMVLPTTIVSTPTPDPTAGWKTYTNTKFGFSVSYPPEAVAQPRNPDPFPVAIEFQYIDPRDYPGGGPENPGWLLIISEPQNNPKQLSLRELALETKRATAKDSITDTEIDGHKAITWSSPEFFGFNSYLVETNKKFIYIAANIFGWPSEITRYKDELDKVLATFKFIAPQPTSSTIEGRFCGGLAGNLPRNQCPAGYSCQLDDKFPDAGGKCVKKLF